MPILPKKGVVTIAFDDGYLDTCKFAIDYLNKQSLKSTVSIPLSFIGKKFENRPIVGLGRLKEIIKTGHEVASHTINHPNLLRLALRDKGLAISEIAESKKRLQNLLKCGVDSFTFPYIKNSWSRPLQIEVKNYYKSARITLDYPFFNKIPLKNPYSVTGFAITKKHSPRYLKKQVDYAAEKKCWLTEVFHLVSNKNTLSAHRKKPYRFFMHIDDFKKHVDYIISRDVLILTQKDGIQKIPNAILNR